MEYTVGQLARLAGVSARTIRFYDAEGLLNPARTGENGYRAYGSAEVDRLQQILFFREMGIKLKDIGNVLNSPEFDREAALNRHLSDLLMRREQLDRLICNVETTLQSLKGEVAMQDREKFEGFGQKLVEENEKKYGKEIRAKYGEEAVERSNAKVRGLSEADFAKAREVEGRMGEKIAEAMALGDPTCSAAREACALHREWLTMFSPEYSPEYHLGLARMYVEDERFKAYYDKIAPGCAEFLRDALISFLG